MIGGRHCVWEQPGVVAGAGEGFVRPHPWAAPVRRQLAAGLDRCPGPLPACPRPQEAPGSAVGRPRGAEGAGLALHWAQKHSKPPPQTPFNQQPH